MKMKRILVTIVAAAVAFIIGLPTLASAASWQNTRYTDGAAATCTMSTWAGSVRDQYANISCTLSDTVCDSNAVYVEWWQDGYGGVRLDNRSDCNKTTYPSDTRKNPSGSFGELRWRVCRDRPWGVPDNCSYTVVHQLY